MDSEITQVISMLEDHLYPHLGQGMALLEVRDALGTQEATRAVVQFFDRTTDSDRVVLINVLTRLLGAELEREAMQASDMSVLIEAISRLIDEVEDAETLSEAAFRLTDPSYAGRHKGVPANAALPRQEGAAQALCWALREILWDDMHAVERADGRTWTPEEIMFALISEPLEV